MKERTRRHLLKWKHFLSTLNSPEGAGIEETDRGSYGCFKEWDKDNGKEEGRETRSVRERRVKTGSTKLNPNTLHAVNRDYVQ